MSSQLGGEQQPEDLLPARAWGWCTTTEHTTRYWHVGDPNTKLGWSGNKKSQLLWKKWLPGLLEIQSFQLTRLSDFPFWFGELQQTAGTVTEEKHPRQFRFPAATTSGNWTQQQTGEQAWGCSYLLWKLILVNYVLITSCVLTGQMHSQLHRSAHKCERFYLRVIHFSCRAHPHITIGSLIHNSPWEQQLPGVPKTFS